MDDTTGLNIVLAFVTVQASVADLAIIIWGLRFDE